METATNDPLKRIPFSKSEEKTIAATGSMMGIAAIVSFIAGVANIFLAFIDSQYLANLLGGAVSILLGVWLLSAGHAFKQVATTDEADQQFMAVGFSKLRNVFLLKAVIIIVAIGLLFINLVLSGLR